MQVSENLKVNTSLRCRLLVCVFCLAWIEMLFWSINWVEIDSINSWNSHSGLTFSISKSCLLRFYNRSTSPIDAIPTISVKQISLPKIIVRTLVSYFLLTSPGLTTTTRSQPRYTGNLGWSGIPFLLQFQWEPKNSCISFSG